MLTTVRGQDCLLDCIGGVGGSERLDGLLRVRTSTNEGLALEPKLFCMCQSEQLYPLRAMVSAEPYVTLTLFLWVTFYFMIS